MKDFKILRSCSLCGETFDSDYGLAKHASMAHPNKPKAGWVGDDHESCSCGCG